MTAFLSAVLSAPAPVATATAMVGAGALSVSTAVGINTGPVLTSATMDFPSDVSMTPPPPLGWALSDISDLGASIIPDMTNSCETCLLCERGCTLKRKKRPSSGNNDRDDAHHNFFQCRYLVYITDSSTWHHQRSRMAEVMTRVTVSSKPATAAWN